MNKKIFIYSIMLFVTAITANLYGSWQAPIEKTQIIIVSTFYAFLFTIPCSITYYFGVNQSKSSPATNRIIFASFFTYFFSYSVCMVLGFFEISWYIFLFVGVIVAFLAGWRLSTNKPIQPDTELKT